MNAQTASVTLPDPITADCTLTALERGTYCKAWSREPWPCRINYLVACTMTRPSEAAWPEWPAR